MLDSLLPVATASLADQTMVTLKAFFADRQHFPSAAHMAALRDVADRMEAMADGQCAARVYLSSIDCGIGKSQTVRHFLQALLSSPKHIDVGALVCVGRYAEIEALVKAGGLPREKLAVVASADARASDGTPLSGLERRAANQNRPRGLPARW